MTPAVFVVNTNVVIAGLITGSNRSPVALIPDAMLSGSLLYVLSPKLPEEYRSVMLRPKLAKLHSLTETEVDCLLLEHPPASSSVISPKTWVDRILATDDSNP